MEIKVRKAKSDDCEVIARILWQSEKEDHALYSYAGLFGLEEFEFITHFAQLMNNEFEGHSLGFRDYWMIEVEGHIAGGFAIYHEKSSNSSSLLATGALMQHFSRNDVSNAFKKLANFKTIQIEKTVGTWQLDTVAIFDEFKGKGVFQEAFSQVVHILKGSSSQSLLFEVQIWNLNHSARRAYEKVGFKCFKEGSRNEEGKGRDLLVLTI
jgi:hypothetical protein